MAKTTDKLTADGKKFYDMLGKLDQLEVRVGFQNGKASTDDGVDICDIAAWNELGTSTGIPARPFIRNTADKHEAEIQRYAANLAQQMCDGAITSDDMLKKLGVYVKGLMQKEIRNGDYVPNAPATIERKGSDKPLIDTGKMRQSVNYTVVPKGGDS